MTALVHEDHGEESYIADEITIVPGVPTLRLEGFGRSRFRRRWTVDVRRNSDA
jgi:hypothetical protein